MGIKNKKTRAWWGPRSAHLGRGSNSGYRV